MALETTQIELTDDWVQVSNAGEVYTFQNLSNVNALFKASIEKPTVDDGAIQFEKYKGCTHNDIDAITWAKSSDKNIVTKASLTKEALYV